MENRPDGEAQRTARVIVLRHAYISVELPQEVAAQCTVDQAGWALRRARLYKESGVKLLHTDSVHTQRRKAGTAASRHQAPHAGTTDREVEKSRPSPRATKIGLTDNRARAASRGGGRAGLTLNPSGFLIWL